MAQDRYACLVGVKVALHGNNGPFRVCRHCGSTSGRIGSASRTRHHFGELRCNSCNQHHSWMKRDYLEALLAKVRGDAA